MFNKKKRSEKEEYLFAELLDNTSESNFEITNEKKVEIILEKYKQYWNGMGEWEIQAYDTTRWFTTILIGLFGFLASKGTAITFN